MKSITTNNYMSLDEFLQKWKINKTLLAEKVGLTTGAFYNKVSDKNADKLRANQKEKLAEIIKELAKDASEVIIE